jgi:hypothetical protein
MSRSYTSSPPQAAPWRVAGLIYLLLAPNYKQHTLSPAEIRDVCYSLAELYVRSVYLNFLVGGGRRS